VTAAGTLSAARGRAWEMGGPLAARWESPSLDWAESVWEMEMGCPLAAAWWWETQQTPEGPAAGSVRGALWVWLAAHIQKVPTTPAE